MNWKLRLRNRATLIALCGMTLSLIYTICGLLNITPKISESEIANIIAIIIELLCALGIITDPTTKGIKDSEIAMTYQEPR